MSDADSMTPQPTVPTVAGRSRVMTLLLAVILIVSLALRLYGLDWDQGYLFHPDERAILMKVASLSLPQDPSQLLDPKNPLNPHWFPYGSFPLYLLKAFSMAFAYFNKSFAGMDMRLIGRVLSALFDTGTIFLIYLLGTKLYGRRSGLLAAAFLAFTVLNIQLSHFYAVDTIMAFFAILTIFFAWDIAQRCSYQSAALAGLSLGLAVATKVSAAPLLVPIVVAYILAAAKIREDKPASKAAGHSEPLPPCDSEPLPSGHSECLSSYDSQPFPCHSERSEESDGAQDKVSEESDSAQDKPGELSSPEEETGGRSAQPAVMDERPDGGASARRSLHRPIIGLMITLLVATITFAVTEPYAFIDSKAFIADTMEQSEMVRRVRDYPYTRQYENTVPYLYHIEQLATWGMGLPLGVVAWGGVLFTLVC
ncbi:MAG: glycosyltransferase family 39 protein, partial [Chloroflexota bacterium]